MHLFVLLATILGSPKTAPAVCGAGAVTHRSNPQALLNDAMECFDQLEDERAANLLAQLLALTPPSAVAARAHLYLGLIDLNAVRTDDARGEFLKALRADALLEAPPSAGPKVLAVFREAQDQRQQELSHRLGETKVSEGPAASPLVEAPPLTPSVTEARESRSHSLSWVLIGVGALAIAAGVYGAVDVLSYKGMVPTAQSASNPTQPALASVQSQAQIWADLWIPLVAAGGLAEGGAVLAW